MFVVQREWIRAATLAPSEHNTQPWLFAPSPGEIRVLPDFARRLPVMDPDDRELYVSLGCAIENLVIAAAHDGFVARLEPALRPEHGIRIRFREDVPLPHPLHAAIFARQTNRSEYDRAHLLPEVKRLLEEVEAEPGVTVRFVSEPRDLDRIAELLQHADRRQMNDARFRDELARWLRFTESESLSTGDGMRLPGGRSLPRWLGRALLPFTASARATVQNDTRLLRSSSAVAVIASREEGPAAWIRTGRTLERFLLQATAVGVQHAYLNQLCQVPEVRDALARRLELGAAKPQIVLRLGFAPPEPRSVRRPVDDVLLASWRAEEPIALAP